MSHTPDSLSTRPATQTSGQEAIETVVDRPPAAGGSKHLPPPAPRFAPKPGVRAEVRPWGAGPGQDVALELLDLSELSVRVRLRMPVVVSRRFEVTLRDPEGRRWARGMATLGWSTRCEDGTLVAVLELGTFIKPDIVRQLGGAPVSVSAPASKS
jgi:hypothetical protein